MNTRSSKEYRYIFTNTWEQASASHLSSRLTDNACGKLFVIFILSYLFVLPTAFLWIPKTHNRTSLQVWHANVLHFYSFCKHFPGLPATDPEARVRFPALPEKKVVVLERGPLGLVSTTEELLNRKVVAIRKKLAITSPASGGRSVGIVRSRTREWDALYNFTVRLEMKFHIYKKRKQFNIF
jgi:hypothetical protein